MRVPPRSLAPLVLLALLLPLAQPLAPGPHALGFPDGPPNDPEYMRSENDPVHSSIFDEQWNLYSFLPVTTPLPGALGETASGISADLAWRTTIGRPDVRIAVLDSGVFWEDRELVNKAALNLGELPLPQGCAVYDCNHDGVVNVQDYANDPRVGDKNGNGVLDAGDLILAFSDGVDNDHNGYVDDIAGWDFWRDDNNPYDEVRFGHGTGEAKGSAAETNNGIGGAGVCPRCTFVPLRIGDSFVVHSQEFAQAVMYAVDNGASVVQSAVGAVNWDPFTQRALDYAWEHGVIVVLSAADEDSFHHNLPGALEHTIVTKSVQPDSTDEPDQLHALQTTSYQTHAACTNWGAHITLASPSTSCSSGATEVLSGVAGLVASRARDLGLRLSAAQLKQALIQGADDINHPESALPVRYPSQPGFDAYFGYGRTNASRSVQLVSADLPEVDVQQPRWFEPILWHRNLSVPIVGHAAFPRGQPYRLIVEVAPGVQPKDADFTELRNETVRGAQDGVLAAWNAPEPSTAPAQHPDDFTWTLRVRVDDRQGHRGEDRKAVGLYQDSTLRARVDLRGFGSLEGSPALADLEGNGAVDIVQADGGGHVHALRSDGSELPGWPVSADVFAPALAHATAPGFARLGVPLDGFVSSAAVGDIDGDGKPEVVAASLGGKVYAWHADGSRVPGFPVSTDHALAPGSDPQHRVRWGFLATPALADLDGDGKLDIIAGSYDQRVHAWNARGEELPGFPVLLRDPASPGRFEAGNKIVSSPAVADLDGDGRLDIVVGTNEVYSEPRPLPPAGDLLGLGGSGRVYALDPTGRLLPGWPARPSSLEPRALPLVGSGVAMGPSIAIIDGAPKVAVSVFGGDVAIYNADGSLWRTLLAAPTGNSQEPLGLPAVGNGAWGDLDGLGRKDYALGLLGARAAVRFLVSGPRLDWQHEVAAWDAVLNVSKPGFPKVQDDWMFFVQPAIGDVDNAPGTQEVVVGSGGYLVHAWDHLGNEALDQPLGSARLSSWPKYTGGWVTGSAAIGKLGNGHNFVTVGTREGFLFVWDTAGTGSADWPMFKHDAARSGTLG